MAELDTSSGGNKKGGTKSKKLSTRVDLTPMVDLGFLLITFFIFTTTMQKPKTLDLSMPSDEKVVDPPKLKASTVLTALLSKDNRIYYYYGIGDDPKNPPNVQVTTFKNKGGVRDAIIQLKKDVAAKIQNGDLLATDKPAVMIKPDTNASYEDVVNMLDEMTINDIKTYAIVDITKQDHEFITLTEAANGVTP